MSRILQGIILILDNLGSVLHFPQADHITLPALSIIPCVSKRLGSVFTYLSIYFGNNSFCLFRLFK